VPVSLGYGKLLFVVQSMLQGFRLTRQRNLALLALGISRVRDGHLTVSEIARSIPNHCDHWVKFKRMKRFLANTKWSPSALFGQMLAYALERFWPGHYLPIIIDQSTLAGRWEMLWASMPFRGRALPIAFRLFTYEEIADDPEGSQNKIEEAFVRQVVGMLPETPPAILLFDRGYARVPLFELLEGLGVHYVVRAKGDVWVRRGRRYSGRLRDIAVAKGVQLWWPRVRYHQEKQYQVNPFVGLRAGLAITRNATAEEPWYLVTNLQRASTAVRWYEKRFRCEELFRDLKDQLHLETVRLQHTERVERLLFGMMVLYYALTLIGADVQKRGLRKKVCKDKVSLAFLALRALLTPWLLPFEKLTHALYISCWSLHYESG
jgi:hypothetical protein